MVQHVGRNDPCPCGSGKKHKNCCEGKQRFVNRTVAGMPLWVVLAIAAGAIAILVGVNMTKDRGVTSGSIGAGPVAAPSAAPTGPAPAPWTYDSTTNRYFDPGHNHWHDGQPPPESARGPAAGGSFVPPGTGAPGTAPPPGATPAPYTYDQVNNRHWDPAHNHWHQGPPPTGTP